MKINIKEKSYNVFNWIKEECKDWKTFLILLCVIIIMYVPVWGGYLMYFIFKWTWCLTMATVTLAFWAGPITPFFPIAIAITLSIKKIMRIKKVKKSRRNILDK